MTINKIRKVRECCRKHAVGDELSYYTLDLSFYFLFFCFNRPLSYQERKEETSICKINLLFTAYIKWEAGVVRDGFLGSRWSPRILRLNMHWIADTLVVSRKLGVLWNVRRPIKYGILPFFYVLMKPFYGAIDYVLSWILGTSKNREQRPTIIENVGFRLLPHEWFSALG